MQRSHWVVTGVIADIIGVAGAIYVAAGPLLQFAGSPPGVAVLRLITAAAAVMCALFAAVILIRIRAR